MVIKLETVVFAKAEMVSQTGKCGKKGQANSLLQKC